VGGERWGITKEGAMLTAAKGGKSYSKREENAKKQGGDVEGSKSGSVKKRKPETPN